MFTAKFTEFPSIQVKNSSNQGSTFIKIRVIYKYLYGKVVDYMFFHLENGKHNGYCNWQYCPIQSVKNTSWELNFFVMDKIL
jgi:hypothetical protein